MAASKTEKPQNIVMEWDCVGYRQMIANIMEGLSSGKCRTFVLFGSCTLIKLFCEIGV